MTRGSALSAVGRLGDELNSCRAAAPIATRGGGSSHTALQRPPAARGGDRLTSYGRRPRIFCGTHGGRYRLPLTLRSELAGKCAREVAYRLPSVLRLVVLHDQHHAEYPWQKPRKRLRAKDAEHGT